MDILNFISWIRGGRVVSSVDPDRTLIPVGLKDGRRDDDYLAGAISVTDFITQVGDTVRPYKVFTALLTQSGGNDPRTMQGDGGGDISSATKGTTVEIFSNSNNIDYSSIGAPNSNVGTYFILTQDITLSNLDIDTIFNINTGAPVATVLENTIGNVWFQYESTGVYSINNNNLIFLVENTFAQTVTVNDGGTPILYSFVANFPFDGKLFIYGDEGYLNNTPIEIRVYN